MKVVALGDPPTEDMFALPPFVVQEGESRTLYGQGPMPKLLPPDQWESERAHGTLLVLSDPLDASEVVDPVVLWIGAAFVVTLRELRVRRVALTRYETHDVSALGSVSVWPRKDAVQVRQNLISRVVGMVRRESDPSRRSKLVSLTLDVAGGAPEVEALAWSVRDGTDRDRRRWEWLQRLARDRGDSLFEARCERTFTELGQQSEQALRFDDWVRRISTPPLFTSLDSEKAA